MTHDQGGGDRSDQSSDPGSGSGDAPDPPGAVRAHMTEGTVDEGWLRPHARRALGRPRVSTIVLILLWVGLFILWLEVHP
ncbi:hypothetical protein BJY24_000894 [Nocardia transvalensis]|uniref:Uncharacterized protein n=1 Tax=Nocardia transvalensis TaxID=37333 RepID=A0A7W9P9P3_9NOCA|nr:hypothetical protein [Nocardia transvalensis]MBB5912027.1 hypothetical protein [Nocardia transvalensis]